MFHNVEHALEYAYRVSRSDIVEVSRAIANLRSPGIQVRRSFSDLTSHDHHAQAAMVMIHVEDLPHAERNIIDGKYDRGLRWPAIKYLTALIGYDRLGLAPTREVVAEYLGEVTNQYGEPISVRAMESRYGVPRSTFHREARKIKDQLVVIEMRALAQLDSELHSMMNKAA